MEKDERKGLFIDISLHEKLRTIAFKKNKPMVQIVREAVQLWEEKYGR